MGLIDLLLGRHRDMKCPRCGEPVSLELLECPRCRGKISEMFAQACPSCKAESPLKAEYCEKCGRSLRSHKEETTYTCPICGFKATFVMTTCPSCGQRFA
jgi:predicted RNA-binding Zn-ribbon protein involved in translation (DUF1610 family)